MIILRLIKNTVCIALFFTSYCHAELTDLNNGIIEDSTLNTGWMKDTNMFKTLCDADHALYQSWTGAIDDSKETICNNNSGKMTWDDANAWITHLNENSYLSVNNWRLPQFIQPDAGCESQFNGIGRGYNCTESELAHLFNLSLANPNNAGTGATGGTVGNGCAPCFINTSPFTNTQTFAYWYDTLENTSSAWTFVPGFGYQDSTKRIDQIYVWPIHTIVAAPVPATVPTLGVMNTLLLSLALLLITLLTLRKSEMKLFMQINQRESS